MNELELRAMYPYTGGREPIVVYCSNPNKNPSCNGKEKTTKESAVRNIKNHAGVFLCRSCSFTADGKAKIAEATSYKRSEATRLKMSKSAKEKWDTEWGVKQKKYLSHLAAVQQSKTNLDKSKRKILYLSAKNSGQIKTCNSSYEYVFCEDFLEVDPDVASYDTQVYYVVEDRERSMDFLIRYKNGITKVVEIKPKKRLQEDYHVGQISDSKTNADKNGYSFEVWTEENLGITNTKEATARADAYRKKHYLIDYAAHRAEKNREKSQRYYDNNIKDDKITVYCEFCKEYHSILRKTYDKAIQNKGRYICEREGGHIGGSKTKPRKINPYVAEGKKQCTKCQRILPFDCFGVDTTRSDGYASRCKECRASASKSKYNSAGPI